MTEAQNLDDTRRAGQCPRNAHAQDERPADGHAIRAGCGGIETNGSQLKADGRPLDQEPDHRHRKHSQDQAEMQPRTGDDDGQLRVRIDLRGPRGRDILCQHQTAVDQVVGEKEGGVVEHDGGNHLVRSEASLERAGEARPDEAAEHTGKNGQRDLDQPRQAVNAVRDEDASQAADVELAFGADIEESCLEAERES